LAALNAVIARDKIVKIMIYVRYIGLYIAIHNLPCFGDSPNIFNYLQFAYILSD